MEDDTTTQSKPLDDEDINILKSYGSGPYSKSIKKVEADITGLVTNINKICGIRESDTGLCLPNQWDLQLDKQMLNEEQPLQVARCTKIINADTDQTKYIINVKQIAKFVVGLGDKVAPSDIEEGMRVGVDRTKYKIQILLPPKIDPTVTMMTVEERPGRIDRKIEFSLPDLEGRTHIFKIHANTMNMSRDVRFELLARLCPNSTGSDIRSVCTEAGMFAIRARRKTITEKDLLLAINKVIHGCKQFSATGKYMVYN
ncbi:hypothetical protein PMLGA01_140013600 [Plasmodium malariae]|uniref:Uncharacterized protein n=1 Tax=Plasmodium malariae TaxID=5858 RepID=A0A1C3L260_PLAMA|nr:hypothetical protein PMLGA01_140013600 [Plasmodium malariae]